MPTSTSVRHGLVTRRTRRRWSGLSSALIAAMIAGVAEETGTGEVGEVVMAAAEVEMEEAAEAEAFGGAMTAVATGAGVEEAEDLAAVIGDRAE